jgi:hypothetical protein
MILVVRRPWVLAIAGMAVLLSVLAISWNYGLEKTNWLSGGIIAVAIAYLASMLPLLRKEKPSDAQRAALELSRGGQVSERFSRATDQLGSEKVDVRVGAIYALEQIAEDSQELYWPIVEILTTFIRDHTKRHTRAEPEGEHSESDQRIVLEPKVAADVQAMATASGRHSGGYVAADIQAGLTVLARRNSAQDLGRLDLSWANIRGAVLLDASLERVNLQGADISVARLDRAKLRDADLRGANLRGAMLTGAHLRGADLSSASFRLAYVVGADLREANLIGANLEMANLTRANLQGAGLFGANLQHAVFEGYGLEAQGLTWDQLERAEGVDHAYLPTYLKQTSGDT